MKIVVGLGNPGPEYANTRHNSGVMLVDRLAEKLESAYGWRRKKDIFVFEANEWVLVKSAGIFMNESGRIIRELEYMNADLDNLYLAHDDLDIRLGEYKIQMGVGPKVHGGVNSVEEVVGEKDFWRVRIGVDNREPNNRTQGEEYVLQGFSNEEKEVIRKVIDEVINELSLA